MLADAVRGLAIAAVIAAPLLVHVGGSNYAVAPGARPVRRRRRLGGHPVPRSLHGIALVLGPHQFSENPLPAVQGRGVIRRHRGLQVV